MARNTYTQTECARTWRWLGQLHVGIDKHTERERRRTESIEAKTVVDSDKLLLKSFKTQKQIFNLIAVL